MALYLLDTSVCVDILRGRTGRVLPPTDECCLSTIVTAELWTGLALAAANPVREEMLEDFVSLFTIRSFDDDAARRYGAIRGDLQQRGILIGPMDLLIAAHARSLEATLITANAREFRRVKDLRVVAWR